MQAAAPQLAIRRVTAGDAATAAKTLSAAFANDPALGWILREGPKRNAARDLFFDIIVRHVGLPANETWMASDGSAASIWIPPRTGAKDARAISLMAELKQLPRLAWIFGRPGFARTLKVRAAMDKHHPKNEPHWYLGFLGVAPAFQGQGRGSQMLKEQFRVIDANRMPAYLEASTEANMRLYLRHGFEVIAKFNPTPDAPPLWAMWRAPR